MIIKEINMLAFGKFHNTRIPLAPGLNVIYGVNESGKTTMHRFIEGMFFGFYKPYSKNKIFTPEHAKYTPWFGQDYRGIIVYDHEGKTYRLERSFSKTRETVKLFDAVSGTDQSEILEFDMTNAMPKANIHLPINNVLFKNTVSIGQLSNITDNDLVREIGDLFVDTSGTHSAGVSLKLAIDRLDSQKASIGDPDAIRTPLGKDTVRLKELNAEMEAAKALQNENMQRYTRVRKLEESLTAIQKEKGSISEQKRRVRLGILKGRYEKYVNLAAEKESLEESLAKSEGFDESLISEYDRTSARLEVTESQITETSHKIEELRDELENAERELSMLNVPNRDISFAEMSEDKTILDSVIQKLENLNAEKMENENTALLQAFHKLNTLTSAVNIAGIAFSITGVLLLFLSYMIENNVFKVSGVAALGCGVLSFIGWFFLNQSRRKKEMEFEQYDTIMSRTMNMILMCELDLEQYRSKYHCRDVDELMNYLYDNHDASRRAADLDRIINFVSGSLNDAQDTLASLNEDKENLLDILNNCMERADADSPESFRYAIARMRETAVNTVKLESINTQIEEILSGDITARMLEQAAGEAGEKGIDAAADTGGSIEDVLEASNTEMLSVTNEIAALKEEISVAEATVRSPNVIAEEIVQVRSRIDRYTVDLAAYSMAIERIEGLSHEIQSTFASAFNEYVSAMIAVITKGKYTHVFVNENMEIKVEDKQTGQLVNVSSLSGGTIDQLYFCVRFAIMDLIIKDKNIPVFLDDCMLQYDDARLNNILDLLYEKSKERQILLFTCRNAEKLALDEKDFPYNHIRLNEIAVGRPASVSV